MLLLGTARLMRVPGTEQNVCCWQADPGAEHWEGAGGPPPSPAVTALQAKAARVVRCGLSTRTFRWRGGPWGRELGDRGKELQMHSRCGLRNFSIPKPKSLAPNAVSPRPASRANAWAAAGRAGGSGSWLLTPSSHPSPPSLGMVAAAGDVACTLVTGALVGPGMTKQRGK